MTRFDGNEGWKGKEGERERRQNGAVKRERRRTCVTRNKIAWFATRKENSFLSPALQGTIVSLALLSFIVIKMNNSTLKNYNAMTQAKSYRIAVCFCKERYFTSPAWLVFMVIITY